VALKSSQEKVKNFATFLKENKYHHICGRQGKYTHKTLARAICAGCFFMIDGKGCCIYPNHF
jgi:hypothetical protein